MSVCGWKDFGYRNNDPTHPLKAHFFVADRGDDGFGEGRSGCGMRITGDLRRGFSHQPPDERKCKACARLEARTGKGC